MEKKTGLFIVIDGTDGSGKTTQFNILADKLKQSGHDVKQADFPQYGKKSAAMVEAYLNGEYGSAEELGPYLPSIFYACDRFDSSRKIRGWLDQGKIVLSNRYVSASMGHQGGKIKDEGERKKYFKWLYDLEYSIFRIPRPDLNLILHVEAEISQKLIEEKEKHKRDRDYLKNGAKKDIHEADLGHLKAAEKVYQEIASIFPDFTIIECVRNNEIMDREEIHRLIWQEVNKYL